MAQSMVHRGVSIFWGDNNVATCMTGRYLSHGELGEKGVVPHFLNTVSSNAHSSSLHSRTLSMDLFDDIPDFYPTFPATGDLDMDLDFNLALATESVDAPTFNALDDPWWNVTDQPGLMENPSVDVSAQGNNGKRRVHHLGQFAFNLWPSDSAALATPQPTQTYVHGEQPYRGQQLPEVQLQLRSSSLANWDGSIATGAASEPGNLAPAPSSGNNTLCFMPLRVRMLTDREQPRSTPGGMTRANITPSHLSQ